MFDSIALLAGEVDRRLGHLDQRFLHPEDIIAELFRVFAFRGLIAQQSTYGRTSKLTEEFTVGARDTLFTQAPDIMLPSYLEIRSTSNITDTWRWVPAVSSAALEQARIEGHLRCCFEKDVDGLRIRLSYNPQNVIHRLRYYSDPVIPESKDSELPLAERFASMFVSEAIEGLVPVILARSAQLEDPNDQLTTAQLQAISSALGHAQRDIEKYEVLFNVEMKSNRNPLGRNRNPILSRGTGVRRTYPG